MAKIDDTEHNDGKIHIDRYYREVGADSKDFDTDVEDAWEADEHLQANWERFSRTYLENHGRQPRKT